MKGGENMQTTVDLPDSLYQESKALAVCARGHRGKVYRYCGCQGGARRTCVTRFRFRTQEYGLTECGIGSNFCPDGTIQFDLDRFLLGDL
jgi:hypothetical protein